MNRPENVYDIRYIDHARCEVALLPQSPSSGFSDRVEFRDGRFQVRHVVQCTAGTDQPIVNGWTDLFPGTRTESLTRWSENVVTGPVYPYERVGIEERLELKGIQKSTEGSDSDSTHDAFGLPVVRTNPFVRIPTHSGTLVVDSISLLQAVLAVEARIFELLVSPFRALAASVHRVGPLMIMQANTRAFRRDGQDSFVRRTAVMFAYFLSDRARVDSLFRLVESIRLGEPLALPIFDFDAVMEVEGWRRPGAEEIIVERIRPAYSKTWMLGPDDVLVVLPNSTSTGAIYGCSRRAIASASAELFANGESLAERLSLEVVERTRRLFSSGADPS